MQHTKAKRARIVERQGGICIDCKRGDVPLTLHHIIPRGLHGPSYDWNLVAICRPCHDVREVQDAHMRRLSIAVAQFVFVNGLEAVTTERIEQWRKEFATREGPVSFPNAWVVSRAE